MSLHFVHYICTNKAKEKMEITITFDLSTWRQGSELLHRLGHTPDLVFTDMFTLLVSHDDLTKLRFSLDKELVDYEIEFL